MTGLDHSGGIHVDMSARSDVLVVAFGGLGLRVSATPPFEFFRVLDELGPTKKLLIRDQLQAWYHRGIAGLADDIPGIATELRRLIESADAPKVVMLGSSAGGYAALLFGRLVGATEVHAFAPQTFIASELRRRHNDHRFGDAHAALMHSGRYQPRYGDLTAFFRESSSNGTRFTVHYCVTEPLDTIHATMLGEQADVELVKYPEGGHLFVKLLRHTGELQPIIERIVTPSPN